MLRVSRSIKDLAYRAINMQEYLTNKNGFTPTYEEIAKELNEDLTNVLVAIESTYEPVSLYSPIYNDSGDTIYLFEQIEDNKINSDVTGKIALKNAINKLSVREMNILNNRYVIGKTQMEISNELGISQAQVSRVESNAIKTLKKYLK